MCLVVVAKLYRIKLSVFYFLGFTSVIAIQVLFALCRHDKLTYNFFRAIIRKGKEEKL